MIAKQHEMDSVVNQVYTSMEREAHLRSSLLVLCGDHGMNDVGNHGGSSVGETSPALLFISPRFRAKGMQRESPVQAGSPMQYYRTVEQADITPTLSGLLGIPIPLNNLGVFISEFLSMWDHGMCSSHRSETSVHGLLIGFLLRGDRASENPYPIRKCQAIIGDCKGNISRLWF